MDKTDKIKQEEFPLPRYVQEVLSKHNISLPSLWGRGKGEGPLVVVCLVVSLLFYHCSFSVSNNVFDMASFASFV